MATKAKKTVSRTSAAAKQKKTKIAPLCQTYRSRDAKNGWTNKDYAFDFWLRHGGICTPEQIIPLLHKDISPNVVASWLSGFDRGGAHPGYPRSARERTAEIVATLKAIGVTEQATFDRARSIKDPSVPLQAKHVAKPVKKTKSKK